MNMPGTESDSAVAYERFGQLEAAGRSPIYERLATEISRDSAVLSLIEGLPTAKRQPNLVLGAAKFLGAPLDDGSDAYSTFRNWLLEHWDVVVDVVMHRATQTNEVGRCATLLPYFAAIDKPLAVLEVGCSAGLKLYPDAYSYRYARARAADADDSSSATLTSGSGQPLLECTLDGVDAPTRVPNVVWRGGIDLNPLDPASADDVAWLKALVWPGQPEREQRLDDAAAAARSLGPKPVIEQGDLVDDLDALVKQVPDDAHLVIFHTAVLAYVDDEKRRAFERRMSELATRAGGFTWISNESPRVMPSVAARIADRELTAPDGMFVIAVDGEPRAWSAPHGSELTVISQGG